MNCRYCTNEIDIIKDMFLELETGDLVCRNGCARYVFEMAMSTPQYNLKKYKWHNVKEKPKCKKP